MSSVNIIRQSRAVHMLTDGISFNPSDASVGRFASKVVQLPHLRAVVGLRGNHGVGWLFLPMLVGAAKSFDDIENTLPEALRILAPEAPYWNQPGFQGALREVEIYVAGWSESDGPRSYCICNHSREPTMPPFSILDPGQVLFSPGVDGVVDIALSVPTVDDLDPVEHGLLILECQRRARVPHPQTGALIHIVGGFAQLTTVTETEITTRVIHYWPDEIGKPISPGDMRL